MLSVTLHFSITSISSASGSSRHRGPQEAGAREQAEDEGARAGGVPEASR